MKWAFVVCATVAVLALPTSATADVTADPNGKGSGAVIGATRADRPSEQTGSRTTGAGHSVVPHMKTMCFFDLSHPNFRCALRTFANRKPGAKAKLTEATILRAVREIGLPSLKVRIQPGASTLVNIPTIFYTKPQEFRRNVTLLGFDIDLVADPVQYTWSHGDGTISTTRRPGKPYPAMDVTYRYREPADTVSPRVDVTYRVRYRVDGGAWATIGQTLLASGPTTALEVKEAAPVLTTP